MLHATITAADLRYLTADEQAELDALLLDDEHQDWRSWLNTHCRDYITAGFAPRHERVWSWFAALRRNQACDALVETWPRGGGKSATAELGVAWLAERQTRRFVLYVCATQAQADAHVASIGAVMENLGIRRAMSVYGHSKGWRREQLRTSSGFNVAAFGLDAGARGVKLDENRPDLICLDDVDARHDSEDTVKKKIETITQTLIPAGSTDCAVLFIQNLVHRNSIASQLASGSADFLLNRRPTVVEVAIEGLEFEREIQEDGTARYRVTGGVPTWDGQGLEVATKQMNDWGRLAFLREAQQRVGDTEDGLWLRTRDIEPFRVTALPALTRIGVGVDPSATATGDMAGVVIAGIDARGHGYVFDDRSVQGSPLAWATAAVSGFHLHHAHVMVAEQNNGGEMVRLTIQTIPGAPAVKLVPASQGKIVRAAPVQKLYEEGRVHHLGVLAALEDELCSYTPGDASPNRLDACVWVLTELMLNRVATNIAPRSVGVGPSALNV
jgi:hypothetical protein